jgi:hypothetical protein
MPPVATSVYKIKKSFTTKGKGGCGFYLYKHTLFSITALHVKFVIVGAKYGEVGFIAMGNS